MKRVVVDASAMVAFIFHEPGATAIRDRLDRAEVFAPELLKFELANAAWKRIRRDPESGPKILAALDRALDERRCPIWQDVQMADATLIAAATGLTAYDASYVWLAGWLGAELVTLDERMAAAGV